MLPSGMKLSIVMPVFNEARTVEAVVARVLAIPLRDLGLERELIAVDDGSTDGSGEILERLAAAFAPDLRVHRLPRNRGKGAAVRAGFARATGDVVVIQDADLELDPLQVPRLVRPILDGRAAVVFGSRFRRPPRGLPFLGRFANFVLSLATSVLYGARVSDMETCYKTFRGDVLRRLLPRLAAERFDIEPEITAKVLLAGHRIHEVPVRYRPRGRHEGKKIRWRDGVQALLALLRYRLETPAPGRNGNGVGPPA